MKRTRASLHSSRAKLNVHRLDLASTGFLDSSAGLGRIADPVANLSSKGGEAQPKASQTFQGDFGRLAGSRRRSVDRESRLRSTISASERGGRSWEPSTPISAAPAHLNGTYDPQVEATVVNNQARRSRTCPRKISGGFSSSAGAKTSPTKGASLRLAMTQFRFQFDRPHEQNLITGRRRTFQGSAGGLPISE